MAYVPAADMRDGSFGKSGGVYASRKEVQESPTVELPAARSGWRARACRASSPSR